MQWKNYRYNRKGNGVVIIQYVAGEETADLLAGREKSLLFDLVDEKECASGTMEADKFPEKGRKVQNAPICEKTDGLSDREQTGAESEDQEQEGLEFDECLNIPSHINGYPVVEIGEDAFSEYGALLTKVEVPSTVKHIGNGAFRMCMSLTELVLHDGLETIGEEAFYLTPLTELYLPSTVSQIGRPWELGNILWKIDEKNPYFFSDGYGLYCKRDSRLNGEQLSDVKTISDTGRSSEAEQELLVVSQQDERTEYAIPDGTTIIGENAFAGNATLQKIIVPSTVHTIRDAAMESCQSLSEIVLSEGLREIQTNAFSHCIRLKELHLPSTVERLGEHALSDTFGWSDSLNGLERITVDAANAHFEADEDALFEFGENCDRYVVKYFGSHREYRIPEDVSRILPSAFRRAKLHKFYVPKSLKDVGLDAFRECKNLEEIYLEESDTVLYVPAQPVYRKDEITALFFSGQHGCIREEPPSLDELPEKWQAFVGNAIYSKTQEPRYNPYEEYIFDYRGYDGLFHTYLNLPDHYGMACCRLKYPVMLPDSVRRKYEDFICENFMDILNSLAETQDMYHLVTLAELGFFTENNIEECLEISNRSGRTKFMSFLLNYKREHLEDSEFDFRL